MTSTIMYKFRSSNKFEPLEMPGTSARLFDVKREIVRAKKLDRNNGGPQLEFDLSVKNAMTNEEYKDETMLLPRGLRVIVQRLPAARGHGLLSKIEKAEAGIIGGGPAAPQVSYGNKMAANSGFYTHEHKPDDDEFIDTDTSSTVAAPMTGTDTNNVVQEANTDEKEIEALKAVTDLIGSSSSYRASSSRTILPNKTLQMGVPNAGQAHKPIPPSYKSNYQGRPNADPELRDFEQQQQQQQRKRQATGIPRTFLNQQLASDKINEDNGDGINDNTPSVVLQPNTIGFQELISRGGGQSESGSGGSKGRRDFDYACKLTCTTVPDHLLCGICNQIVKNAMLIPWDTEGRTTCESCIRDRLAADGFRCPLTGNEGVSPDDLLANHGLRKAADLFIKGVMEKMDEIIQEQDVKDQELQNESEVVGGKTNSNDNTSYQEDGGMIMRKMNASQHQQKRSRISDDLGDDDFGGDVFDVSDEVAMDKEDTTDNEANVDMVETSANSNKDITSVSVVDEKQEVEITQQPPGIAANDSSSKSDTQGDNNIKTNDVSKNTGVISHSNIQHDDNVSNEVNDSNGTDSESVPDNSATNESTITSTTQQTPADTDPVANRRENLKNRRPPAGYVMGPAGGASVHGHNPIVPVKPNKLVPPPSDVPNMSSPPNMGWGDRAGNNPGRAYSNFQDGQGIENGDFSNRQSFDNHRGRGYRGGRGRGGRHFQPQAHPPFMQQGRGFRGGHGGRGFHNGNRSGGRGRNGGRGSYDDPHHHGNDDSTGRGNNYNTNDNGPVNNKRPYSEVMDHSNRDFNQSFNQFGGRGRSDGRGFGRGRDGRGNFGRQNNRGGRFPFGRGRGRHDHPMRGGRFGRGF